MKELIFILNNRRNNKYKYKLIKNILNDDNRVYYTSLNIFNLKSLKIISNNENSEELEELYYLSEININNFLVYHYDILITELTENFKEATCIKLKLSNIDILLGFDINDVIYSPLYYILKDELRTWLELIYYTNKLLNEYLVVHNLALNLNFFSLYKFDTIIENGFTVIIPYFEDHII
jgi:hypothetical protein